MKIRVLFVDDSADSANITKKLLQKIAPEIEIIVSNSIDDALKLLKESKIGAIVSDYFLRDTNGNGIELFKLTRKAGYQLPFILYTAHLRDTVVSEALNLGINYYMLKEGNPENQLKKLVAIITGLTDKTSLVSTDNKSDREIFSDFMHVFNHDARNILHNILGYAQLLEDEYEKTYVDGIIKLVIKCEKLIKSYVEAADEGDYTREILD